MEEYRHRMIKDGAQTGSGGPTAINNTSTVH